MAKKIDRVRASLSSQLPLIFTEKEYQSALIKLHEDGKIGLSTKKALLKDAQKVSVKWNTLAEYKFMSLNTKNVVTMDILLALQPKYYFSHHSALYFNELTDQKPEEYFLSHEEAGRTSVHSKELAPARIRQAFLKAPRKTEKYLEFKKTKIFLLEKQDLKRIGVEKRIRSSEGSETIEFYCTNIERTLIDALISPHYSGGIKTVLNSYAHAQYDLKNLLEVYRAYSPYYPYWQSIGFVLHRLKGKTFADEWSKNFDKPEIDFYLDRNVRDDWNFDPQWRIHYPKGLL